jgi:D-sedoheptulose 7-phosphate isomerase
MQIISRLNKNMNASIEAKKDLLKDSNLLEIFRKATESVIKSYRKGGRLYIAGNGGSAADAQHLAAEFISKLARDRASLPAESLVTDSSVLTAIGNDYGFENIFLRQLTSKLTKNDIFLGITTSGNSINIIRALEYCRNFDVESIVFNGRGGGAAASLATYSINVPGLMTSTIQELHIILAHTLCESVEAAIFDQPIPKKD